ncbi:uncharacterized protein LOC144440419 [Glandiceps talaboti]
MVGTHLVFIDSLNFLNASLEKLVGNTSDFKYTKQEFPNSLKLLTRKGVYPYDYMDSIEKFNDVNLPQKENLNEAGITDEDYEHSQNIWKHFDMQTMGDYHDLYLKTDVLLLTDVFENFRKTCNVYYNLDPCHYFSAPGLSWDACLKMSKINLELLTDIDMHLFIEKGLRGGISYISTGLAKANNPYMKDYDPTQETKYIMYLDANNLYGWAMTQSLPTHGFKWVDLDSLDLSKYTNESDHGLILEVDLEYPSELHDLHNDYPLAPEKLCITEDMLSPHNKKIRDLFNIKCGNIEKLTTTLRPKNNYVLHFQNLKQFLSLGLKITKIHRAIEFNQSKWMSQYILFNTRNAFEKDFFKLMNNSVFGRTMMNVRKHRSIKLCITEKQMRKLVSKPTFVMQKIITESPVAVENKKERLTLNQPLYVGMSILDLSKILMYDFHYNYIKEKYGPRAKLLFTDTDSLMYEIQTNDL